MVAVSASSNPDYQLQEGPQGKPREKHQQEQKLQVQSSENGSTSKATGGVVQQSPVLISLSESVTDNYKFPMEVLRANSTWFRNHCDPNALETQHFRLSQSKGGETPMLELDVSCSTSTAFQTNSLLVGSFQPKSSSRCCS